MNKKKIIVTVIAVWFLIALGRTIYNYTKVFSQDLQWAGLSQKEQKAKTFGDLDSFLRFVDTNTASASSILVVSSNGTLHYLSKYYLYPKHSFFIDNFKDFAKEKDHYLYIALFTDHKQNDVLFLKAAEKLAASPAGEFSTKQSVGLLYKND
ncbi:MAG TPA: hypothetical protein VLF68_01845 [Candidatus Saccharimonadales bacterium]|nr:hypothetical protein [Candidatus Saccharimonadales bacterium]